MRKSVSAAWPGTASRTSAGGGTARMKMSLGRPSRVAINSRSRQVAGVKRRLNSGITKRPSDSTSPRSSRISFQSSPKLPEI